MLVIVRDEAALHHVMSNPDIAPGATIVLDRRSGNRRRAESAGTVERRSSDRRRQAIDEALERDGYAIVETGRVMLDADDALA
jgi:hypothetical protein